VPGGREGVRDRCAVFWLCLGPERQTDRRAVGHLHELLRAVLATQTQLISHLHPCVHALAARADFELPGWASQGPAVWAAVGVSGRRASSGQLAACTVCSMASRLHGASWWSRGPLRAAAARGWSRGARESSGDCHPAVREIGVDGNRRNSTLCMARTSRCNFCFRRQAAGCQTGVRSFVLLW